MAYSDFTLQDVVTEFGLVEDRAKLFDNVETLEMSEWLKETFEVSLDFALSTPSEKAKSEFYCRADSSGIGKKKLWKFRGAFGQKIKRASRERAAW